MKCRLKYCDIEARSRGLCIKHYRYFSQHNCIHMFAPTRLPKRKGCKAFGCSKEHSAKGYCVNHYRKFVEAKYKDERPKKKCLRCRKIKRVIARGLCDTCYRYIYNKSWVSKPMLRNIELFVELSNIHFGVTAELWQREFSELKRESSDRTFERVKKLLRELEIPIEVKDGKRYIVELNFNDLAKVVRNRFKHDIPFDRIPKEQWVPARNGRNKGKKLRSE